MYIKDSIIMNYAKRFYNSDLFMALLVGLLVALVYICVNAKLSSALTVQPSQEFGKTMLNGQTLEVKPVAVTSFNDVTEPNDVQPALGYNMDQRTYNPQSTYAGTVYTIRVSQ